MLVSEAKKKLCPYTMESVSYNIPQTTNQSYKIVGAKCIGGDCMAWVWTKGNQIEDMPETFECYEGYCARIQQ